MRQCADCHEVKPDKEFYPRREGGYYSYCRPCHRIRSSIHRIEEIKYDPSKRPPPAVVRVSSKQGELTFTSLKVGQLWRTYKLTPRDYAFILDDQQGLCAICRERRELVIDHCHRSGHVRGLLCSSCNRLMGLVDLDKTFLKAAIQYKKRGSKWWKKTK